MWVRVVHVVLEPAAHEAALKAFLPGQGVMFWAQSTTVTNPTTVSASSSFSWGQHDV